MNIMSPKNFIVFFLLYSFLFTNNMIYAGKKARSFIDSLAIETLNSQNSPWGVASHPTTDREWENRDILMKRAREAGFRWIREDFAFGSIYDSTGNYNYTRYDSLLNLAEKHSIQILPILEGFDHEVVRNNPHLAPLYDHPEKWREFVKKTVQRYHGKLKYWEIWNEQDGGFWKPQPNAAQYVSLLKIAYEEIKKIDPQCQVLVGGMIAWNAGFLEAMYNAGAKGYFDIIAVHPYGFGPDVNLKARRMHSEVVNVLKKHESKEIPIWITESGGSSFEGQLPIQHPDFILKAIRYALSKINNIPDKDIIIGLAVSPRIKNIEELSTSRTWLPGIKLKLIPFEKLTTLTPSECQVLIGAEGLNVDKPLLSPYYQYIARGGLLLGVNKVPFHTIHYQDEDGVWLQRDAPDEVYVPLRMNYEAAWTQKDIPSHTTTVGTSEDGLKSGLPQVSNIYVDRFLNGNRMAEGDKYFSIIQAYHNSKYIGDGMGLYTYKDKKGGVLLSTISLDTGYTEDMQANLLQRLFLTYLALGVKKIFWYDLHNDGFLKGEREHNFGLLNYDWSPKKAFFAYQEMTQILGKRPVFLKKIEGWDPHIWALLFENTDTKEKILATWTTESEGSIEITQNGGKELRKISNAKVEFILINNIEQIKF